MNALANEQDVSSLSASLSAMHVCVFGCLEGGNLTATPALWSGRRFGQRLQQMEAILMKGVKGLDERASLALSRKADFAWVQRLQDRLELLLADRNEARRATSPMAAGVRGQQCLSCNGPVRRRPGPWLACRTRACMPSRPPLTQGDCSTPVGRRKRAQGSERVRVGMFAGVCVILCACWGHETYMQKRTGC